jgi:hypothetical protein
MSAMMPKTEAPPEAKIRLLPDKQDVLHGRVPDMSKQTHHQSKATTNHDTIKNGPKNDGAEANTAKRVCFELTFPIIPD